MPRTARKVSPLNMYHIILRGINKQIIFTEKEDHLYFLKELLGITDERKIKIHAYCLMNNHVHMLVEGDVQEIGSSMKCFGTRFAMWYNRKYERCGPLFQDRYKSASIDSEAYFLTVLRYILQNPMNAGMENEPGHYYWTSYSAYVMEQAENEAERYAKDITFTETFRAFFNNEEDMKAYLMQPGRTTCMEYYSVCNMNDQEAIQMMYTLTGVKSPYEFQMMDNPKRNENLIRLKEAGLSCRQINRYTGVSVRTITKVCKDYESEKPADKSTVPLNRNQMIL